VFFSFFYYSIFQDINNNNSLTNTNLASLIPKPSMGKHEVASSNLMLSNLDLRVGRIAKVTPHPNNEKYYVEEVEIGNGEVLEISSELQPYFSDEELIGRKCVVLCNIRPVKVSKVKSQGEILYVKNNQDQVELIKPPEESKVGDRVYADGETVMDPMTPIQLKKQKCWEHLRKELKTNFKAQLVYKDRMTVRTRDGPCTVESIKKTPLCV
jgi:tRNA-binding EMAP/Myf-like protein